MPKKQSKMNRTAAELVKNSTATGCNRKKWTETLSIGERGYLNRVISAMKEMPNAAPYVVAKALKEELGLETCVGTIAKTLKELLKDG
jgi:hypothetical protein